MSSIPLSRILQTKKTNGDADKEQFDKQMVNIQFYLYLIILEVWIVVICFIYVTWNKKISTEKVLFLKSVFFMCFFSVVRIKCVLDCRIERTITSQFASFVFFSFFCNIKMSCSPQICSQLNCQFRTFVLHRRHIDDGYFFFLLSFWIDDLCVCGCEWYV